MGDRQPILKVEDVAKRFVTPEGPLVAIERLSLDVRPGEFLAVIGPSGCGKSTLFSIIGGLMDADSGRVSVAGETVRGPHAAHRAADREASKNSAALKRQIFAISNVAG